MIWIQWNFQFGTISFQWICFSFDFEGFVHSGFQFGTISLQWIRFSFDLERFGYSGIFQFGMDDFAHSGFAFIRCGAIWLQQISILDDFAIDLERFGYSEWVFHLGRFSLQRICLHSIWSDLATADSVWEDCGAVLRVDLERWGREWNVRGARSKMKAICGVGGNMCTEYAFVRSFFFWSPIKEHSWTILV